MERRKANVLQTLVRYIIDTQRLLTDFNEDMSVPSSWITTRLLSLHGTLVKDSCSHLSLTRTCRKYFKNNTDPYSVWLFGARVYILTDPNDVANMYKNTATISYHSMIEQMHYMIECSQDGIDKLFAHDPSAKHNIGKGTVMVAALRTNDFHRDQLYPGPHLDDLYDGRIVPYIWNTIKRRPNAIENPTRIDMRDGTPVSLMALMVDVFDGGITSAFFGAGIWKVNPALLRDFMTWEVTNWKWTFQLPKFMSGDMIKSKDAIINTFVKWLQLPVEERQDRAYFPKAMEEMMRDIGVSEEDMAKTIMLHFWA